MTKVVLVLNDEKEEAKILDPENAFNYKGFVKAGNVAYPHHKIKEIRFIEEEQKQTTVTDKTRAPGSHQERGDQGSGVYG